MTPEIFQSLQGFTDAGLIIVIIGGGFWLLAYKGYISFDFRTKDKKSKDNDINFGEILASFNNATKAMKEMSNDNMHQLSNGVLDVVKIRFEAIENLIQNEIAFQNKNLVSGMRDEIKLGLVGIKDELKVGINNIGGLKSDIKDTTKKLGQAVNSFDKICKNCEYKNKK